MTKFLEEFTVEERDDFFKLVAAAGKLTFTVERIEQAIAKTGDIGRAAVELGCSRRALQINMRKLGFAPSRGGRKKVSAATPAQ